MRVLLGALFILALAVSPAFGVTASKDGSEVKPCPSEITESHPQIHADWEYNTGGTMDYVPELGGSASGWGEWFITIAQNTMGMEFFIVEFGFPCAGPPTGPYGWILWTSVGGPMSVPGPAETAEFYGSFTPVDPNPHTFPPTTYTYIDVSSLCLIVQPGDYFCFGYENTGMGGMTYYNGVPTWGWWMGGWEPDWAWGRTAILQVKANLGASTTEMTTWGAIKGLYQ